MSVAEKLTTIAENMPKVYEAGQKSEYDRFWDSYQYNGGATYYPYSFAGFGWRDETFKPKYNVAPVGYAEGMFRQMRITNLKRCLEKANVTLDLSKVTQGVSLFGYCAFLTTVPKINLSSIGSNTSYLFSDCTSLVTIEELTISETVTFGRSCFYNCPALTRLILTGTLATNGLDLHWSTKLDRESLLSIIGCLKDYSEIGGTWSITLGTENLAKLTDAEKAIATQKGWTLV